MLNRFTDIETSRPTELNKTEARHGVTGHNVRYVLALGLLGVVIGFAVVYWVVSSSFGP